MHHDCRREAVEICRGRVAVGTDLFAVKQVIQFEVGQIFRHRNHVQRVARRAEDGTNLRSAFLERFQVIMAVVKNHAGERVIHAVVDVVAKFPVAHGLADDFGNGGRGGGAEETPRLGENLHAGRFRKQAIQFAVDDLGEFAERLDARIIWRGETAADVQQVHLGVAAILRLLENVRRQRDGLDVIFKIRRLAADMKADALDGQAEFVGFENHVHRLARRRAEFGGQLHHRAGVRHFQAQHEAGLWRKFFDFPDFLKIVERDERLVLIEFAQCLHRLDGIGVNDLVPNPVLPLLRGQVLDVFVDVLKLRHRGDIEARANFVKRPHDGRIGIGLDRVVSLHARQIFFEHRVVRAQFGVVHDEQRRAVLGGEFFQRGLGNHFSKIKQPERVSRSGCK